jgi:hypothetical protein
VLADTLLADTDDDEEEDVNNEEKEDIDDKEEDIDNEEEEVDDDEEENKGAIDNMPPKLKQAAVTPSKKTVKKSRSGETRHHRLQEAEDQHTSMQALLDENAGWVHGKTILPKIYQLC